MEIIAYKRGEPQSRAIGVTVVFFWLVLMISCSSPKAARQNNERSGTTAASVVTISAGAEGTAAREGFEIKAPAGAYGRDLQVRIDVLKQTVKSTDGLSSLGDSFSVALLGLSGAVVRELVKPVEITLTAPFSGVAPDIGDFYIEVFDPLSMRLIEILRPTSVTFTHSSVELKVTRSKDVSGIYQIAISVSSGQLPDALWKAEAKVKNLRVSDVAVTAALVSWAAPANGIAVERYSVVLITEAQRTSMGTSISEDTLCSTYGFSYANGSTSVHLSNLGAATTYYLAVCSVKNISSSPIFSLVTNLSFTTAANTVSDPAPTVLSLTPSSGSTSGSITITITGTNFVSGATATLGGSPCTTPEVVSATKLTCVSPVGVAGTASVVVTNPDLQSGSLTAAYSYIQAGSWTATSTGTNTPDARYLHSAFWTGTEMVLWGGKNGANLVTGGRYDLVANSWRANTTTDAPLLRLQHAAVWTGSEMIIWGGYAPPTYYDTGGRYDPVADSWTPTSTTNAPSGRNMPTAVWTGSKMIVWGGYNGPSFDTGGIYDPVANSWTATQTTNAPGGRNGHTAIWTGSKMIVWGGGFSDGGLYDPIANSWTATQPTGTPASRTGHSATWTGSKMIIWGGYSGAAYLGSGGVYDPVANSWTATQTTNAPAGRITHSVIWTGSKMIIWGGYAGAGPGYFNTGGIYDPSANTWTTIPANSLAVRGYHSAVWTGSQMIIWGGYPGPGTYYNDGAIYTP